MLIRSYMAMVRPRDEKNIQRRMKKYFNLRLQQAPSVYQNISAKKMVGFFPFV